MDATGSGLSSMNVKRENDSSMIEYVVLLDEHFAPIGTAPKAVVHTTETPLHLAFSCYVFDMDGRILITRRALGKKAWPGVWSNSFCGHPGPGEDPEGALRRRGAQELGMTVSEPSVALADFRYEAQDVSGIVENEFCPVWTATVSSDPRPVVDEVCEWRWIDWRVLIEPFPVGAG
ncbi:isopentenyl-diphosphate Delta-isomerase [Pseudonocardia sp. HH130630-07]|uniref:isopentenyl-diphosphate Delta-isomerase n=1 Tax=Pseudonocardia sp. HH130630-07 TaxID=1690815 RepID=UPI000B06FD1F|nr:isopentenyl-diphosphate Delta-isomerase [Pseudonocardia sp. HH130630-07]